MCPGRGWRLLLPWYASFLLRHFVFPVNFSFLEVFWCAHILLHFSLIFRNSRGTQFVSSNQQKENRHVLQMYLNGALSVAIFFFGRFFSI